jgi:hexosaminidase
MQKTFAFPSIACSLLLILLCAGCSPKAPASTSGPGSLAITWTLVSNQPDETCNATFTFRNTGKMLVGKRDWALYFNQNTLTPAKMPDAAKGTVEHINGDLYRFLPGPEFSVAPGDSLTVRYTYSGMMIKQSDAPAGAYLMDGLDRDKDSVFLPLSFKILPFDTPAKLFPDPTALATIPTAASEYARNQQVPTLPEDQVGKVIPSPYRVAYTSGSVDLRKITTIAYIKPLDQEANYLVETMQKLFGHAPALREGAAGGQHVISLQTDTLRVNGIAAEAYRLSITEDQGVRIMGADAAGVFYGIQSLLALAAADKEMRVPCGEILDAPRFAYRGFLLDVARNFQRKEDLLRLIDLLAMYKINTLNIRISDDEGWRIEISGLPELTAVGGRRGHTRDAKNWLSPSFGSGPFPDAPGSHGTGYYSREEFKEIIRYAHQRHVRVIPEVCLPSHARAAIKAMEARYDYYMARKEPAKANEFRLIDPDDQSTYLSAQMYKDNIVCVALPSVYHFYETVVKDFVAMYKEAGLILQTFNTGGDEVPNGAWAKSPLCAALMKTLPGIKHPRQLQGYFLGKAMAIFEKYQLQVTGWEEIVLNKNAAGGATVNTAFIGRNVLPLVWDNTDDNIDLGYRIANSGYPVVLCNVTNLYFDLAYNTDPVEPGLYWGGFQDAIDPYVMAPFDVYATAHFDMFSRLRGEGPVYPGKVRLKQESRRNIVGLQAQLWSETLRGPEMMEYYIVPKIFAFAEKAWSPAPQWEREPDLHARNAAILQGWAELANRIGRYALPQIDRLFGSYAYRIAPPGAVMEGGMLHANTAFPGLVIRYTTDGTEPGLQSPEYTGPVQVTGPVRVRAFNRQGRGSRTFQVE